MPRTSGAACGFSVVIPVKNARPYLPELCDTLGSLRQPPDSYEVVFIDDRSSDRSLDFLAAMAREDPPFKVVTGAGKGPAAARNRGVAASAGRFIAFTDPDALPSPDWLTQAARALEAEGTRALEGAVLPWNSDQNDLPIRYVVNRDGGRYMTANMVYERELLEAIGGFDESFALPHFLEDSDLAFRVLDRGVRIPFHPEVQVRHRHVPLSPRMLLNDAAKLQWMSLLARKHPRRYRQDLRHNVQALKPGDAYMLLALPLAIAARRGPQRVLAWANLAMAVRRVLRAAGIGSVPRSERLPWIAAALAAPAARTFHLGRGAVRFGRLAL